MTAENHTCFSSTNNSGMAAEKPPVILVTVLSGAALFGGMWLGTAGGWSRGRDDRLARSSGKPDEARQGRPRAVSRYGDHRARSHTVLRSSSATALPASSSRQPPRSCRRRSRRWCSSPPTCLMTATRSCCWPSRITTPRSARICTSTRTRGSQLSKYAARAELFANDGPEPLKAKLPSLILDEPVTPLVIPVNVTDARFGRVNRSMSHHCGLGHQPHFPGQDGRAHARADGNARYGTSPIL